MSVCRACFHECHYCLVVDLNVQLHHVGNIDVSQHVEGDAQVLCDYVWLITVIHLQQEHTFGLALVIIGEFL
jgi:hypothetical protein